MNSVTGLFKPGSKVMLRQRRFYTVKVRRKKQIKSVTKELDGIFKILSTKTNSVEDKNANFSPQRVNEFNIQMLSECLYKQLYNNEVQHKPNSVLLEKAKNKLKSYGLGVCNNYQNEVELKLPPLRGNIEEHFWSIGDEQSKPYRDLVQELITLGIPKTPKIWVCKAGWTKYTVNEEPVPVQYPDENAVVMDVEVCMKVRHVPALATAVSSKAWYGWVSPIIAEKTKPHQPLGLELFIPLLGTDKPTIVLGHSVSFDRGYIKEEYDINNAGVRFLDTMALHISVGTFTSKRHLHMSYITLKELYQLYCNKELFKDKKSVFLTGELIDIKTDFQNLMAYCANDSKATFEVLQVIFPKFLQNFPHPITLAGMLEMSLAYLPVTQNWRRYIKRSSEAYDDLKDDIMGLILRKTDNTCRLLHNDEYKSDMWMWGESWKTQTLKLIQKNRKMAKVRFEDSVDEEEQVLDDKFKYLFELEGKLPQKSKLPFMPGYPRWYRLLHGKTDRLQLSPGKVITPKILRMKWENFPIHYLADLGWGILVPDIHAKDINTAVPFERLKALAMNNLNLDPNKLEEVKSVEAYYKGDGLWCDRLIDNCCYFYKLGDKNKVRKTTTILTKDFSVLDSAFTSDDTMTNKVLRISEKIFFWRKYRSLINDAMVIWLDNERGVILPRLMVSGTVTRRANDSLWLREVPDDGVGSELRAMVHAPMGYHIIGGHINLDLWIASLLGDSAQMKIHGSTPLGWVTLNGIKSSINSIIARDFNLPLRQAEFLTACRLYGSGVQTTERHLKKLNPNMTSAEVKRIARKIHSLTKGVRLCRMKNSNKIYHMKQAKQLAKTSRKVFENLFSKPFWWGGMESFTHNSLETLITAQCPTTPFLSSRLCESLDEKNMYSRRFMWMVQSSGVDFLHLLLVCMRWLTNGRARYCFSFHDEVRYLIPSSDRYNGALALHVSSLLVKAFCSHKLGMYDLPLSVAFFPSVGVDTTLRKDVCNDHVTPSNPHGLKKEYGIAPGEELDIYEAIAKTGGSLEKFNRQIKTS